MYNYIISLYSISFWGLGSYKSHCPDIVLSVLPELGGVGFSSNGNMRWLLIS